MFQIGDKVVHPMHGAGIVESIVQKEVNGVTLSFRDSHYRFVPPDYEPSDEEKKLERRGELTISEGSDEVEDRQFQSVSWQKDGMSYSLYGFDTGLDAQTMLELASGLVE